MSTATFTDMPRQQPDDEHAALIAACDEMTALCTIVGIEGRFSRRLGAQLALRADGQVIGSLSDGCLEQQLASDVRSATAPVVRRYGHGSQNIDFRLPCGGGLDILIDPAPDHAACREVVRELAARQPAQLKLADNALLKARQYIPALHLRMFGEGPELSALQAISNAANISIETFGKNQLSLGQQPQIPPADQWTAVVMLFHDHEWEIALLQQALASEAFYIGAQGGEKTRLSRLARLHSAGMNDEHIARLRDTIGTVPSCRTPNTLALSVLSEIAGEYEKLQP